MEIVFPSVVGGESTAIRLRGKNVRLFPSDSPTKFARLGDASCPVRGSQASRALVFRAECDNITSVAEGSQSGRRGGKHFKYANQTYGTSRNKHGSVSLSCKIK